MRSETSAACFEYVGDGAPHETVMHTTAVEGCRSLFMFIVI